MLMAGNTALCLLQKHSWKTATCRAVLLLGAGHLSFFDHAAVTNTKMSDYAEVSSFVDENQLPQTPHRATLVFPQ